MSDHIEQQQQQPPSRRHVETHNAIFVDMSTCAVFCVVRADWGGCSSEDGGGDETLAMRKTLLRGPTIRNLHRHGNDGDGIVMHMHCTARPASHMAITFTNTVLQMMVSKAHPDNWTHIVHITGSWSDSSTVDDDICIQTATLTGLF